MLLLKELPDKKILKKLTKNESKADPSRTLFAMEFLRSASDALIGIEKFLASKGISHGRLLILSSLQSAGEEGLYPYELADSLGVTRATASGMLKGLLSDGYVTSSKSENDGRMKKIILTDAGNSILGDVLPNYYSFLSELTAGVDKKTLKQFAGILSDIKTPEQ